MSVSTGHTRIEKLLLAAARTFNSTLEYEELNELVLRMVTTAVSSEAAMIYRLDPERKGLRTRFMNCNDCKMITIDREPRVGIVGWVVENREPVVINNTAGDDRFDPELEKLAGLKIRSLIALPLVGQGKMIGVVAGINKEEGEFTDEDLDVLTGLNHQIAVAISNAHLYREAKREALEKTLLYESVKKLSGKLKLQEVLAAILDSLNQVVSYDSGGVYLCDDSGVDLDAIYTVGYDNGSEEMLHLKCDEGLVGAATTSGEAVIVPDVRVDQRYLAGNSQTKSEVAVPIKVDERVVGVINLESEQLDAFGQRDVALISAFASQAGISLERAKLHEAGLEARKIEEQLNVARETQRSFLPKADPRIRGYDIAGRNISSGQVGGDYYDFINIVDSHLGVAIADVSGKGMPAALIMASFRASLIAEIRNNYSIRTIAEKVNSLMCESLEKGNFVTGVYGVLDSTNHIFTFTNFGHNPPFLLRANGRSEYLTEGGIVLGVTETTVYEERALMLAPGEIIVLYTDGVTEVFDASGREFGSAGLEAVIRDHEDSTAVALVDAIQLAVTDFAGPGHAFDDLTLVVIKRDKA